MTKLYDLLVFFSLVFMSPTFPLIALLFCLINPSTNYCKELNDLFDEISYSFSLLME
jgi:hypothetical protein